MAHEDGLTDRDQVHGRVGGVEAGAGLAGAAGRPALQGVSALLQALGPVGLRLDLVAGAGPSALEGAVSRRAAWPGRSAEGGLDVV